MIRETIRAAARRKGLSFKELAEMADVDYVFLRKLGAGQRPPRTARRQTAEHDDRYRRIAEAIDVDPVQFARQVREEQLDQPARDEAEIKALSACLASGLQGLREDELIDSATLASLTQFSLRYCTVARTPRSLRLLARRIEELPPAAEGLHRPEEPKTTIRDFLGKEPVVLKPPTARLLERLAFLVMGAPPSVSFELQSELTMVFMTLATRRFGTLDDAIALADGL